MFCSGCSPLLASSSGELAVLVVFHAPACTAPDRQFDPPPRPDVPGVPDEPARSP